MKDGKQKLPDSLARLREGQIGAHACAFDKGLPLRTLVRVVKEFRCEGEWRIRGHWCSTPLEGKAHRAGERWQI
ncbi:MAG TPA: hypothetical protein VN893_22815, partial [Bryobacteraceae bacterium]|nr:hypothetical protein [Bryobacteraceae bacterium]